MHHLCLPFPMSLVVPNQSPVLLLAFVFYCFVLGPYHLHLDLFIVSLSNLESMIFSNQLCCSVCQTWIQILPLPTLWPCDLGEVINLSEPLFPKHQMRLQIHTVGAVLRFVG